MTDKTLEYYASLDPKEDVRATIARELLIRRRAMEDYIGLTIEREQAMKGSEKRLIAEGVIGE